MLQPSNVTPALPSHSASPPLPTMLTLFMIPPSFRARHRTSVIISLEAPTTFLQSMCIPSLCDEWPSGATDTYLSHPNRPLTRYARDGQLVLEFLCKTGSTGRLSERRISAAALFKPLHKLRLVTAQAGRLSKERIMPPSMSSTSNCNLQQIISSESRLVIKQPGRLQKRRKRSVTALQTSNFRLVTAQAGRLQKQGITSITTPQTPENRLVSAPVEKLSKTATTSSTKPTICNNFTSPVQEKFVNVQTDPKIFLLPKMRPYSLENATDGEIIVSPYNHHALLFVTEQIHQPPRQFVCSAISNSSHSSLSYTPRNYDFNPNHRQSEQQLPDNRRNNPRPLSQSGPSNKMKQSDNAPSYHHQSNQHPPSQNGLTDKLHQHDYSHQHHSHQHPSHQYQSNQYPSNQHQLPTLDNPVNYNQRHSSDPMNEDTAQFNPTLDLLVDHPLVFTSPPTTLKETVSTLMASWLTSPYTGKEIDENMREKITAHFETALATYFSQPNALQSFQAQAPSILSQAVNNSKVIIVQPKTLSSLNPASSSHSLEMATDFQPANASKIVNAQSEPLIPPSSSLIVNDTKVGLCTNFSIPPLTPVTSKAPKIVNKQINSTQPAHVPQYYNSPINPSEIQYRRQRHDSFVNHIPFQSSSLLPDVTPISMPQLSQRKEDFTTPLRRPVSSRHSHKDLIPPKISRQIQNCSSQTQSTNHRHSNSYCSSTNVPPNSR